jgi:hypothetical protein
VLPPRHPLRGGSTTPTKGKPVRVTTCQNCGTTFASRSTRARYCGDRCRSRARYTRATGRTALAPIPIDLGADVAPGELAEAIRHELAVIGQATTSLGLAAVAIATRIDSGAESSTGLAALTRELRACLAEARAQGDLTGPDALLDIQTRRDQRRAAAADFPVVL